MIPFSPARLQPAQWQRDMAEAITDPRELLRMLDLDPAMLPHAELEPGGRFPLRIPRYFAGLMSRGNPNDPLLAQVLPSAAEHLAVTGFVADPVGDQQALCNHGLLQKYHGRALAVTTGACAVHCRYCFRRHYPYADQSSLRHWQQALGTLRTLPDVSELILSGGDPLTLSDARLAEMVGDAARNPQLTRLRIHTRVPVVLPSRVTSGLCDILASSRLQAVVVIHANHPNEVTPELGHAVNLLTASGVRMLNQSVLLKSVNDHADTLAGLSEALFDIGVLPYYLHLLDPVAGAAHFDVSLGRARQLYETLQRRLPGYLVPRMVREIEGAAGKTPISQL